MLTHAIVAFTQLGLADEIGLGTELKDLADAASIDPQRLQILLRYLCIEGIVVEQPFGSYSLSPLGELLRTEAKGSLKRFVLLWSESWFLEMLSQTSECIRSNLSGPQLTQGKSLFDFLDENSSACQAYDGAVESLNEDEQLGTLIESYPFHYANTIVDVGGGTGSTLAAIVSACSPKTKGILFDRAALEIPAKNLFARQGLEDRCFFIAGDFLVGVPKDGDIYILKWILIDWDDNDVRRILSSIAKAMHQASSLIIVTGLREEQETALSRQTDLLSLVLPGGIRRSSSEIEALCASCGFVLSKTLPIQRHWLMEFRRLASSPVGNTREPDR